MILTDIEIRVLGSLIEKELTTPAYYPLSLNGLRTACNQKSNRNPVMDLSEDDINHVLIDLKAKKLAVFSSGASQRVTKYKHNVSEQFNLERREIAILAVLFLRGEQTLGEIKNRTHRMYDFENLFEVEEVLQKMADREIPLATSLPKQPGQKEQRFIHLLSEFERDIKTEIVHEKTEFEVLQDEVASLKIEVESLKTQLEEIKEIIT